jgi:hypothetical protein
MLASQSMALRYKLTKIFNRWLTKTINRWPVALIMLGGALTLFWLALLIWFPMHLLQIV